MTVQIINKSKHQTPSYETILSAGMDLRANISESLILKPCHFPFPLNSRDLRSLLGS